MPTPAGMAVIGPDLATANSSDIRTVAQVTAGQQPYKSGTVVIGNDGRKYIYGKTAGSIANAARVDFVFSTSLITAAAAGAYVNNNTAPFSGTIDSGGSAWFASVQNYLAATGLTTAAPPG